MIAWWVRTGLCVCMHTWVGCIHACVSICMSEYMHACMCMYASHVLGMGMDLCTQECVHSLWVYSVAKYPDQESNLRRKDVFWLTSDHPSSSREGKTKTRQESKAMKEHCLLASSWLVQLRANCAGWEGGNHLQWNRPSYMIIHQENASQAKLMVAISQWSVPLRR